MLAGRPEGRAPLLDIETLFVADAFHTGPKGAEANALSVARALDWLISQNVGVIGMSLAGGDNRVDANSGGGRDVKRGRDRGVGGQ